MRSWKNCVRLGALALLLGATVALTRTGEAPPPGSQEEGAESVGMVMRAPSTCDDRTDADEPRLSCGPWGRLVPVPSKGAKNAPTQEELEKFASAEAGLQKLLGNLAAGQKISGTADLYGALEVDGYLIVASSYRSDGWFDRKVDLTSESLSTIERYQVTAWPVARGQTGLLAYALVATPESTGVLSNASTGYSGHGAVTHSCHCNLTQITDGKESIHGTQSWKLLSTETRPSHLVAQ